MFVNDIPDLFNQACNPVKHGYTDLNSVLYTLIYDLVLLSKSQTGLQECLSKLEIYTKKWKLKINRKKGEVLLFRTPTQRRAYLTSDWLYEENPPEQVDEYCYLGITFHFSGNFKRAQIMLRKLYELNYH
jgi:hypothetical protein